MKEGKREDFFGVIIKEYFIVKKMMELGVFSFCIMMTQKNLEFLFNECKFPF
jgi:hypothetical protein